uniref:acyl carrier protein n=1 Tax=Gracilaria baiana TaxID=2873517 RepID=UPI001D0F75EB|nr:acyl carrier protein [Gracilaria baiana]UAD82963.1 acyl carrier protein [Gracilaria baiana]
MVSTNLYESVTKNVYKIISEQLTVDLEEINEESSFESLKADSLDVVEVLMAIEEEFGIEIPDEETEHMVKVKQVVDYIVERISQDTK